jgi:hypothetical protein
MLIVAIDAYVHHELVAWKAGSIWYSTSEKSSTLHYAQVAWRKLTGRCDCCMNRGAEQPQSLHVGKRRSTLMVIGAVGKKSSLIGSYASMVIVV